MTPRKATACLISWKRPNNFARIIPHLLEQPWIDEIIIHDNAKGPNIINYGRYMAARRAKNDLIYVQDDDAIITPLERLYEAFDNKNLAYGMPEGKQPEHYGNQHMAIMGWGALFDRRWVPEALDLYTREYGMDKCFFRETDRIFSMNLGRHHTQVTVDIEHLPGYDDQDALSMKASHIKYKQLAIERSRR